VRSYPLVAHSKLAVSSASAASDLADPLRIVAIGGGTGLSSLLHGLKRQVRRFGPDYLDITAVVTVTDDGGSSGRLRREFAMLPPGDIRNCMVALSEDEALLAKLFQYRFTGGQGLAGHSFGNLFLTALTHVTGDFTQAIATSSEILAIHGQIYPSTSQNVGLIATLQNGKTVKGETAISRSKVPIQKIQLDPEGCKPLRATLSAIEKADLICLGPGSLFTSVIPNLLVRGIPNAIAKSKAIKVYFCNIMSQPGETTSLTASDHVKALLRHARKPVVDVAVVNTSPINTRYQKSYADERAFPVENDYEALAALGIKVIKAELLADTEKVRHHSAHTAQVALELAMMSRADRRLLAAKPVKRSK
jgi:uncharacterized cofD-like protein